MKTTLRDFKSKKDMQSFLQESDDLVFECIETRILSSMSFNVPVCLDDERFQELLIQRQIARELIRESSQTSIVNKDLEDPFLGGSEC